jgi:ATP-binding cassette subfamily F protein 3
MDILGKETLEEMISNFAGTVLFVSHDRYFIKKAATSVLEFKEGETKLYPFGYEQYLEKQANTTLLQTEVKPVSVAKEKKTYTTPLKERSKAERAVKKSEERISVLEQEINSLNEELIKPENISDYVKLSELQNSLLSLETELEKVMTEWEEAVEKLSMLDN